MKTLGGPRRNMDPIDAYRLEQEKKRAQQDMQNAHQDLQRDRSVDGYRISRTNTKVSSGKLTGMFGVLALLSFAATFILGFAGELLPSGYEWLLPALFGSIFFFGGLAVFSGSKQLAALLFVLIGGGVSGFSIAYGVCDGEIQEMLLNKAIPAALLSVFVIAGLVMLIAPRVSYQRKCRLYTQEVRAVVTAKHERIYRDSDGHRHKGWRLDWKYYAGGKERVYRSNIYRRPEPRDVGHEGVLYLREDDPNDAWEKSKDTVIIFGVIGLIFAAAGVFFLSLFFFTGV